MTPTGINLLHSPLPLEQIATILATHSRKPLLPPLGAPEWKHAAANPHVARLIRPLRAQAERECAEPLPALSDELYASFAHTGVRLTFENVYFERRRRLARAAINLLLCTEDDPWRERFTASVVEKFTSIFEEVSWALPAHVNWDTDDKSGKDPLQIDLFCAETANLAGEMLDLFGTVLPHPLQTRVKERLRTAVFENYLSRPFHWKTITNNWNAVCHQGVIGSALAACDDNTLLAQMLVEMRRWLPNFLNGFTPDGGCTEGAGYWGYGFGRFAILNQQLEARSGLSLFEGNATIHEMAKFGYRTALKGGNTVNFADGLAHSPLWPPLATYLARRLDDPNWAATALDAYQTMLAEITGQNERDDLFYFVRLILDFPEDLSVPHPLPQDHFFPDLSVMVARGTDRRGHLWEFAAKAGHNGEHHNHNDCGSYLLNIDATPLICEIGMPEYDRDYFSDKRYENLAARTLGHSLPIINGHEQKVGRDAASTILLHELTADHACFSLDATQCYPPEASCTHLIRHFQFDKTEGKLTVTDTFDLTRCESLETGLISTHSIELCNSHLALIETNGLRLAIRPIQNGTRFKQVDRLPYRNHSGQDDRVFRLSITLEKPALQAEIAIAIELL